MVARTSDPAIATRPMEDLLRLVTRLSTEFLDLPAEELDAGIEQTLGLIGDFAGADRSYLFRFSPDGSRWSRTHEWVAPGITPDVRNLHYSPATTYPWISARLNERREILVPDVAMLPPEASAERREFERQEIHSLVNVPLLLEGKVVGLVGLDAIRHRRAWSEETIALLKVAAAMFANGMASARDHAARRRAEARMRMQHALAQLLVASTTVQEAMPEIIRVIGEALHWDCGAHWRWEASVHALRIAESWTRPGLVDWGAMNQQLIRGLDQQGGFVRAAWNTHEPQWYVDVAREPRFMRAAQAKQAGLHGANAFPILAGERPLGVIEFFSRAAREPDAELVDLGRTLGHQIGLFIARRQAEQALRQSEERFRQLTALSSDWYWEQDADLRFTLITGGVPAGIDAAEHLGKTRWELPYIWSEEEKREHREMLEARKSFRDVVFKRKNRSDDLRYLAVSGEPVFDAHGTFCGYRGVGTDITDRMRTQERLAFLANYDELTGLPNRLLFRDRLRHAMREADRHERQVALLFLDLDEFKTINDTFGHATGDRLLQAVAQRILSTLRAGDTVSRFSGDEFALLLTELAQAEDAAHVARYLLETLSESFTLDNHELTVSASLGITLYPADQRDTDELLKAADIAMYRAKEAGKNTFRFFSAEMAERVQARQALETALRRALTRGEFALHYQPVVDLATGAITGVEALLRWNRGGGMLMASEDFISVAEDAGLVIPIGEWALQTVCAQARAWDAEGLPPFTISVNLSARQVHQRDLPRSIERALTETGLAPTRLILELTETALLRHVGEAEAILKEISALGVQCMLDDFGTGYSSLSYLQRFPISAVKLDRSFVRDIPADKDDAAIATAVINMAHSLGIIVIAEGVETAEQLAFLRKQGCDAIQGYHFSGPLAPDDLAAMMRAGKSLG